MEFAEWAAYDRLSPIGPERADWRAALIASILANIYRGKGQKPYTVEDFTPKWEILKEPATAQQVQEKLESWVHMHNATMDKRRKSWRR